MILLSYSRQLWHAGPSSLWCLEDIKTPIQVTQLFCGEKVFFSFLWRLFLLLKVYTFYHPMLVLNAFAAISEGSKLKMFRGSMPTDNLRWHTSTHSKSNPRPRPPIVNLPCTSALQSQTTKAPPPPPRDLPLRVSFGLSPFCIAAPHKKNLATGLNRIQS